VELALLLAAGSWRGDGADAVAMLLQAGQQACMCGQLAACSRSIQSNRPRQKEAFIVCVFATAQERTTSCAAIANCDCER
jgi:hypothetical protein